MSDQRSESSDRSSDRSVDDSPFWPRSDDCSHQLLEAERLHDMNRSAPQSDAVDGRTQSRTADNAGESPAEPQELSSGSHGYHLRPRAKINYKDM
jgi:hypothetical protein